MTESEFLARAAAALDALELALEQAADTSELDLECSRSGNVLEVELIEHGSKIIINSQAPMQEIWVASKSGGFHYKPDGERWINTRDGSELRAALEHMIQAQSGTLLKLRQAE